MIDIATNFLADEIFQREYCQELDNIMNKLKRSGTVIDQKAVELNTKKILFDHSIYLSTKNDELTFVLTQKTNLDVSSINDHDLFANNAIVIYIDNITLTKLVYNATAYCLINSFRHIVNDLTPEFEIQAGHVRIHQSEELSLDHSKNPTLINTREYSHVTLSGKIDSVQIQDSNGNFHINTQTKILSITNSNSSSVEFDRVVIQQINIIDCGIDKIEFSESSCTSFFLDKSEISTISFVAAQVRSFRSNLSNFQNFSFSDKHSKSLSTLRFYNSNINPDSAEFKNIVTIYCGNVSVFVKFFQSTKIDFYDDTVINTLVFDHVKIERVKFGLGSLQNMKWLEVYYKNRIPYAAFPHSISEWPDFSNVEDLHCEKWMRSFSVLAKTAEEEGFFDRKNTFVIMAQRFRSRCSHDHKTRIFLKLYGKACGFGQNPIYPALWWLLISCLFLIIYWCFSIIPYLNLPSQVAYLKILEEGFYDDKLIPSVLNGMFPFLFLDQESYILAFFTSIHKIFSGFLFFLIGFYVRNQTKLGSG